MHDATTDPLAETRHALKNRLTTIRGWAQLLARESRKPDPDPLRLAQLLAKLDRDIVTLSSEIERRLGPSEMAPPGTEDTTA